MHNELTTKMTFFNSNNILHGFDTRFNKMSVRDDSIDNDIIKNHKLKIQLDLLENKYVPISSKLELSKSILNNYKIAQFCFYNGGLFTNNDFSFDDFI